MSWFERNPKKTILLLVVTILLVLVFAAEKYCAYRNRENQINADYRLRYIRLKESPPLMSNYVWPSRQQLEESDNLKYKKYRFRADDNGFIIPSKIYPDPDYVLVFLGGSTTECFYVGEENRFPYQTGYLLEKKLDRKINSYNGGTAGNNSFHSLFTLMSKVLPLHPQVVVMMHNINDLIILLYEGSYFTDNPAKSIMVTEDYSFMQAARIFIERFIPNFYQTVLQIPLVRELLDKIKHGDEFAGVKKGKAVSAQDKARVVKEFGANLQIFIDICKSKGIIPVLMTMPSRVKDHPDEIIIKAVKQLRVDLDYSAFKQLFDQMNETIRSKARENGVTVIDLARQIPPDREQMYDIVHLTDKGSQKAAEIISNQLAPMLSQAK